MSRSLTYPDGTVVERGYTARGELEELEYAGDVIDGRTYDDGGRLVSETLGNGLTVTRTYATNENLLAAISNAAVGNYSYTWDANHNKLTETISGAISGYGFTVPSGGYDDEDRLVAPGTGTTHEPGPGLGPVPGGGLGRVHPEHGRPDPRAWPDARAAGGRLGPLGLRSERPSDHERQRPDHVGHEWAADSATVPNAARREAPGTHDYEYDVLGRRVAKTVDDVAHSTITTTVYVHADAIVFAEYLAGQRRASPGAEVRQRQLRGRAGAAGERLRGREFIKQRPGLGGVAVLPPQPAVFDHGPHRSHRGRRGRFTPTRPTALATILDGSGDDAAGGDNTGNPHQFTARTWDAETGLYGFRARMYSAGLGRFVSRDRLQYPDGPNAYAGYFVPDGLDPTGMVDWIIPVQARLSCALCPTPTSFKKMDMQKVGKAEKIEELRDNWKSLGYAISAEHLDRILGDSPDDGSAPEGVCAALQESSVAANVCDFCDKGSFGDDGYEMLPAILIGIDSLDGDFDMFSDISYAIGTLYGTVRGGPETVG
ncbi:MAG: RHS repeat-associated core domain-containing protein [Planctomyces sp.]|nr:RHS repeat-associated core domain-containing protein [Planctomyces sp.]